MATYQELRTRSQQVRDEQNIGGNTALRVGQLLMDIVKYFYDTDMAASEYLEQHFAMVNDGTHLLNWQQSPIVILHTMGDDYDDGDFSALSQGENYYRAGFIMEANGQGGGINGETPKANVLYVNLANDTLYTWNGASFDAITSGGGGGISGDDIIKNAYYSNGNLVLIIETESGDKTVTIPVTFDASNYVPTSRTVNGKALNNNITLSQSDIPGLVAALAAKVGYSDDEWLQVKAGAIQATTAVQDTTTVNGKRLNNNIVIGMDDIPGLAEAISEAGEVKSVTINGTNHTPDSSGVIDLGTIQGAQGPKGDTGNVQVDGNGNVLIYNGRDKTTTGAALDAYQGQFLGKMLNAKDNTFYNVWVGTQAELEALADYDDNTIYIVGTIPTVVQRFNVSFNGGDHTSIPANTPHTVTEGSSFSVVVSPASGYTIDTATGTMVGGTLTKTNNQDGTVTFSTSAVTGAISIQAAATIHITGITVSAGTRTNNSIPLSAVVAPSGADNVTLAWSVNDTTNFDISGSGTSATLTVKSGASNASVTITCQDTNASSGTASGTLQLTGITYEVTPIPIEEITDISSTRTAANTLTLDSVTDPVDANTPAVSFSLVGNVPTVKQVRRWAAGDTVDGEVKESAGNDLIELPAVELNGNTLTYKCDCQVQVQATADNVEPYTKTINIVHDNADAIWFEDSAVKSLITSKGIGSGGNITYAQAAAVTTFKINNAHTFQNNTTILRFMEYKFFTSATTIGSGASSPVRFDGCTNLKAISTPRGGTIPSQAFITLKNLEELEIDSNATSGFISYTSNYNAELKSFKVGEHATALNQSLESFTKLTTVDLGSGISSVPAKVFKNCSALRNVTLRYNGKITKSDQMFYNLTSGVVDLYVPSEQVTAYASYDAAIKEVHAIEE